MGAVRVECDLDEGVLWIMDDLSMLLYFVEFSFLAVSPLH